MSDTPETDATLNQYAHHLPNWLATDIVAAVSRKLERERDEQKRLVDKLKVQLTKALEAVANRTS